MDEKTDKPHTCEVRKDKSNKRNNPSPYCGKPATEFFQGKWRCRTDLLAAQRRAGLRPAREHS